MKVLQINTVCGIGSTGRIVTDIHNTLIKLGYDSYIAYGRGIAKNCNNAINIGSKFDVYKHALQTRILDIHGFGSRKVTQGFVKKVEKLNPDIIHLHNIHGYYINIEILFDCLKKLNKPVIWTLHDCWAFTGHCAYFDYVGCNKWKTGCYNCPQKRSYPSSILFDNSKKNYNKKKEIFSGLKNMTIVTPSNWLAELVRVSFLGDYNIKVINNGIDVEIFNPTESEFRKNYNLENKFIILGVANIWDKRKGIKYFFELSSKLQSDEVIVLVGLTKKQKKELPSKIIGICRTNNVKELAEIYTAADVFVNPTLEDNFPTTNLESLACGTPVITFSTGGSVECIEQDTGFVVSKGKTDELLCKIKKIREKGKEFYSKNAVVRANKLYNKEDRCREYIELYVNNLH
ncbi:glycosyl transferase [Clostridium thermosuccinogenes]|uniref:Glycosyl transferase n=1 Tax=Clostridium thermosuccinogenes TaxID=84032 RepID=A0A2K2FJZ8_9CLOT|nr:glycosyltransferase [Pseudoclostridium thermosuccinogenes]AUS95177.1 glycosyl transferase [Pseudoclostridium thermosuccinogenes]PNT99103.1 glycosyl transferase [Pseudoclostridium thermosuccinogenes]PNU00907.1 glycosyl transferase [Pseudoclostridium thermosuccinogenes]